MNQNANILQTGQAAPLDHYPAGQTGQRVNIPEHVPVYAQPQNNGSWKQTALIAALGVATVVTTVLIIRRTIHKAQTNKEQNLSIDVDHAATKAKLLKMAFDNDGWPGTDEQAIREVFRGLKDRKEYDEIIKSYKNNYHRNLNQDLESELTSKEYQEMIYILATKPGAPAGEKPVSIYEAWARRLEGATEVYYIGMIPGTDEEAIYAVFNEIPNYAAYQKVEQAYQKIYSRKLYDDLCGEMWYWEVDDLIKKVKNKH